MDNFPVEGDAVIVLEGQTLVVDIETPVLKLIVVKGKKNFPTSPVCRSLSFSSKA